MNRIINKKNIYKLSFLFLFTGLLHTSCMEDSFEVKPDTASSEEGYFSINLNAGDVLTQTKADKDDTGSAEELKIHSVRIVLYNGEDNNETTCNIEYTFEFDITTPDSWNNTGNANNWVKGKENATGGTVNNVITPSGNHLYQGGTNNNFEFITFGQKVKRKPYKMLVLINGKAEDPNVTSAVYDVTTKGKYFLKQFKNAVTPGLSSSSGVLTGGKGILMSNHQNLVEVKAEDLKETAKAANENPVKVNVDRMVAKVGLKHADNFSFPTGIVKGSQRWALDATNKKTYWMRGMTDGESKDLSGSMSALYAKDPNYSSVYSTNKEDEFNYIRIFDEDENGFSISPGKVTNSFDSYQYVLENTVEATTKEQLLQVDDQLTRIIVGYKYIPEGFAANDNYYVFKNTVVSQNKINSLKAGETEPETLKGIKEAISKAETQGYKFNGAGTDYFEVNGIKFCPKGQIYYSFPIRHFNKPEGSLGYYGIVRNNIYDVSIKSLTPPDVVDDEFFMSGEISIQPWAKREQSTTIGITVNEEHKNVTYMKVFYWDVDGVDGNIYPHGDYRIVKVSTGEVIESLSASNDKYGLLLDLNPFFYRYATPGKFIANENPDANVMVLYYSKSSTILSEVITLYFYFVDENGKILSVLDLYTGMAYSRDIGYWDRIAHCYQQSPAAFYYFLYDIAFINQLSNNNGFLIWDGPVPWDGTLPYKIKKDTQNNIKFYRCSPPFNGKVTIEGQITDSDPVRFLQTEPAKTWHAIICEKK